MKNIFRKNGAISLGDVNLPGFPMLQSARATISLRNGRSATAERLIPRGGSGTDIAERKELVAARYERAFGRDPGRLFTLMDDPGVPVRALMRELMGRK